MQIRDRGNKREAQTAAFGRPAPVQPVVSLENVVAFVLGDAGAVIRDAELRCRRVVAHRNLDPASGGGMSQGVLDQVDRDLPQKLTLPRHRDRPIGQERQVMAALFGRRFEHVDDAGRHLGQIDRAEPLLDAAALDLGDLQK